MKQIVAVLLDRKAKTISFAVKSPASAFVTSGASLNLPEFSFATRGSPHVTTTGNTVSIEFR